MRVALSDGSGKEITFWAHKLAPGSYRKVNSEGEWGADNVDRRFIGRPADIIAERPAGMSRKYGTLALLKAGEEFVP